MGRHWRPHPVPIARLRFTATTGPVIDLLARPEPEVPRVRPEAAHEGCVQAVLDYIADSGDPIFWG